MLRPFDDAYYPSLIVRPAEMQALEELPESEKDSIFPILQICPWASSNSFENTHNKIRDVYGERPLICDLDRSYSSRADRDAVTYYNGLCNPDNQCEDWIELISRNPNYIPCIQMFGQTSNAIQNQIETFHAMERGMAFRFNAFKVYDFEDISELIRNHLQENDSGSVCFIVDVGLIDQVAISQNAAVRLINNLREFVDVRIIISSASFPRDFTFIDGMETIAIKSRQLFDLIRAGYNDLSLSYSDWGSTKPRSTGIASAPLPRIDFPVNRRWVSARSKSRAWTYRNAAEQIARSVHWENRPNVWGVQMIERTSKGDEYGIDSSRKASSARINIHLFTQNHYEGDVGQVSTDEPWEDI